MTITCGDLFCGGGGWVTQLLDVLSPQWAIDKDPEAVKVYRRNISSDAICADLTQIDPYSLSPVDVLFASPPCQQWSVARSSCAPQREDAEIGIVLCRYLEALKPKYLFLENVRGYVRSQSLYQIEQTLYSLGYWIDRQIIDAADFGVPQNRIRVVLRAVRGGFPPSLPPKKKTRGWYEAIADLIPTLEPSQLAPWQLKRLPPNLLSDFLIDSKNANPLGKPTVRLAERPAFAVCASSCKGLPKAVIVERTGVRSNNLKLRSAEQPAWTIRCSITTDGRGNNRSRFIDAIFPGQVLQLNIRALARFQSFPDWYVLPERMAIAGRIIGNAVPPLMARALVSSTLSPSQTLTELKF
ncbi:hypothetical protein C7B80_05575 [Cyanosarcina cf. burmensis CCALA 770]|nr:hypothetical protein C7B80_05575 [Cyanosarcina cf. burmensis CCALA 770]